MPTRRACEFLLNVERRKGCLMFFGRGSVPLRPVTALSNYLHLRGAGAGSLFLFRDDLPLTWSRLSSFLQSTLQVFQGSFLIIALKLELPLLWLRKASLSISLRCWVADQATCTSYMCAPRWKPSFQSR